MICNKLRVPTFLEEDHYFSYSSIIISIEQKSWNIFVPGFNSIDITLKTTLVNNIDRALLLIYSNFEVLLAPPFELIFFF